MANALKVTFFGSSGPVEPFVLMTGLSGCRGFAVISPADVANSLSFWDSPDCGLFGGAITWGNVVVYLQKKEKMKGLINLISQKQII